MFDTKRFAMPLLDAAQAQKHVTVNEALIRADALGAGRVESRDVSVPPISPLDGEAWIVGPGATGEWSGHDGELALFLNGGWAFVLPWVGASFWVNAEALRATWIGDSWMGGHVAGTQAGAATLMRVIEFDHVLAAAPSSVSAPVIPDKALVMGVTGRVVAEITGTTGWSLGVAGAVDRYGTGYGTSVGSFAHGVTGQPQAYFGTTAVEITAEGGSFAGGEIRLAVHCLELAPPA